MNKFILVLIISVSFNTVNAQVYFGGGPNTDLLSKMPTSCKDYKTWCDKQAREKDKKAKNMLKSIPHLQKEPPMWIGF